jgi:hypothetical protein
MLRDAWASLYRWHVAGEMIRTIDGNAPELSDDLELAIAPFTVSIALESLTREVTTQAGFYYEITPDTISITDRSEQALTDQRYRGCVAQN